MRALLRNGIRRSELMNTAKRLETDSLGTVEIAASKLYGVHTQRAIQNFPRGGGKSLGDYPHLVTAMLRVKQACATTNREIGALCEEVENSILASADLLIRDSRAGEFPIASLHGGGGTSANMNVNEVLANMAEEALGGKRGEYRLVHPNDHVNLNQSTNDVYPTACRLAILACLEELVPAHRKLDVAFVHAIDKWGEQSRLARTCLQDAVAITFSDFFNAYRGTLKRCIDRITSSAEALHEVNLGGTICGRSSDVPSTYLETVVGQLSTVTGNPKLRQGENLFDAAQNADDILAVSSALDLLARQLIKISADLRLLNSGPVGGIKEIDLPATQAGSSIMPGKVNPVIPEYAMQLSMQTTGLHQASAAALAHAELDLNVWESLITCNTLDMTGLLSTALTSLAESAVAGLEVLPANIQNHLESPIARWTELAKVRGYSKATEQIQRALKQTGQEYQK